jgi:hypothetical protein
MRLRRCAALLAIAALAGLFGCVVHRGPWRRAAETPEAASATAGYSLVAIGNPGVPGRRAARVADRLGRVLEAERAAGRRPIVLWLGDLVLPERPRDGRRCGELDGAWARPGSRELHAVVREHVQRGGQAFAALGPTDRTCGHDQALLQADATSGPHPWTMPGDHYLVRIGAEGRAAVASTCDGDGCRVAPDPGDTALELVIVDANAWIHPPPPGTPGRVRADASVERLGMLLDAIADGEGGPPRVLVGSIPVEAAGAHGHGGRFTDATFHNLPPALKEAIARGDFVGSVGARDGALYAAPDLTDAIKCSDRTWVQRPLFQVVSGSASWPDERPWAIGRRLHYFRGNAYRPRVYSDHLGLAVLRPTEGGAQAELQAYRLGRWETARVPVSLAPAKNPIESASPGMAPCRDCPQMEASQRQ